LDLICDEQDFMAAANLLKHSKALRRRSNEPTLPENWLDDNGSNRLGSDYSLERIFQMTRAEDIA
jgi:hypothetical protein